MENCKLFSIVVPVYNVEKFLCECVDSILTQEYKDFEIILVDDGSKDTSGAICDRYASKDVRIKVVHKKNGGLPSARNAGIKVAQGKYIVFIDSDDYIRNEKFLWELRNVLVDNEADIITYGHTRMQDATKQVLGMRYLGVEVINEKEKNKKLQWLVENDKFSVAAWMHAIKREFLESNNLYFNEEYRTEEDIDWIYRVFAAKPELCGFNNCDYVYRIRENSICHSERKSYFWLNRYNAILSNVMLLRQCDMEEMDRRSLFGYLSFLYYVLLGELWDEPNPMVRKNAFIKARELQFLTKYNAGKRNLICKLIMRICGFYAGSYLINKYMHRKHNSL